MDLPDQSRSIGAQLPPDCVIRTTSSVDGKMHIALSMTLETPEEARALGVAIEKAIIPLLEMGRTLIKAETI